MSRTVQVKRPQRKKLGEYAVIALKRNPKNGQIVNQEWWDSSEFRILVKTAVSNATTPVRFEHYPAESIPRWIRWLLPKPESTVIQTSNSYLAAAFVGDAVESRLEEDRN